MEMTEVDAWTDDPKKVDTFFFFFFFINLLKSL